MPGCRYMSGPRDCPVDNIGPRYSEAANSFCISQETRSKPSECSPMAPAHIKHLWLYLLVAVILSAPGMVDAQFFVGFYNQKCPTAEAIVNDTVLKYAGQDPTLPAALLRLHFHDCFVEGCDGSVLLENSRANPLQVEKNAAPNLSVRGFDVVDAAKTALEAACPGVVSCADIVALAARDSVVVSGGPTWQVPTGRRDGRVSLGIRAAIELPLALSSVQVLTQSFARKGLTQDEMITLSGAHTIGRAHCSSFINRLYGINGTDASLDPAYAKQLKGLCPNRNSNTLVPLDVTSPLKFDNSYFTNLVANRGLMSSDQVLHTDLLTQFTATLNSQNDQFWSLKFTNAMIRMSSIEVKLGTIGEIRSNCRFPN